MVTLTFIEHDPAHALRQKELIKARARAHAARISHARRRIQQTQPGLRLVPDVDEEDERALAPLGPMSSGNSDPFKSFDIEITPELSRVLTFCREGALAAHYMPSAIRKLLNTGQVGEFGKEKILLAWQDILLSLEDEGIALARLATYNEYLSYCVYDPTELGLSALKMQKRSLQLLRSKLENYTDDLPTIKKSALKRHIFGLFDAECFFENTEVARVHFRAFQQLALDGDGIDMLMALRLLYIICHTAAATGKRTLSVTGWISRQLEALFEDSVPDFPLGVTESHKLHEFIKIPQLRRIFVRRRYFINATECLIRGHASPQAPGVVDDKQLLYMYVFTSSLIDLCRLSNIYHDLNEGILLGQSRSSERYTMAAITLALNCLTRDLYGDMTINGVDFHDYSSTLLNALRLTFTAAYNECHEQDKAEFAPAFLWVLYVGALHEHRREYHPATIPAADDVWFSPLLARQAQVVDVHTWAQMEFMAQQFFCTSLIEPDGSNWFEPLLERYEATSDRSKVERGTL